MGRFVCRGLIRLQIHLHLTVTSADLHQFRTPVCVSMVHVGREVAVRGSAPSKPWLLHEHHSVLGFVQAFHLRLVVCPDCAYNSGIRIISSVELSSRI